MPRRPFRRRWEAIRKSPVLLTALAAVQHRQGLPWEEEKTLNAAQANGICYAPLHLALANYFRFNSYYATALRHIQIAHQLDPYSPEIQREWVQTLPKAQRIEELKKYLAANDSDTDEVRNAKMELAVLESQQENNDLMPTGLANYDNRYPLHTHHVQCRAGARVGAGGRLQ